MAEMWGADPEELAALSRAMVSASDRVNQLTRELNQRMHDDVWRGPDAARARAQWDSTHRPALQSVASALHSAGGALSKQAAEQRDASSAGGGTGLGAPVHRASQPHASSLSLSGIAAQGIEAGVGALEEVSSADDWLGFAGHGLFSHGLGAVSLGAGVAEAAEGLTTHDVTKTLWGSLDAVTAFYPPGGRAADIAHLLLPASDSDQSKVLDFMARDQFGRPMDELSPGEASTIVNNLSGPTGIIYMMSETLKRNLSQSGGGE